MRLTEVCTQKHHVGLFVLPPELVWGKRGENGCERRGSTPARCFYKGWDRGYVQEGMREDPWGGPLSPRRCCAFCRSPPSGSRSRTTCPRCSTDHRPPGLWSAPPCRHSCKMTKNELATGMCTLPLNTSTRIFFIPLFGFLCRQEFTRSYCSDLSVLEMRPQTSLHVHHCYTKSVTSECLGEWASSLQKAPRLDKWTVLKYSEL